MKNGQNLGIFLGSDRHPPEKMEKVIIQSIF